MTKSNRPPDSKGGANSPLKFTRPVHSKAEIIRQGQEAAELMSSPVFAMAFESTIESLQQQMILTEPHETQKREWLNHQIQALRAVTLELTKMAALALQLKETSPATLAEEGRNQAAQQRFRRGEIPGAPGFDYDTATPA